MSEHVINSAHLADVTFDSEELDTIASQAATATAELCDIAGLKEGNILVIGCSSSEVIGEHIGTFSSPEVADALLSGILSVLVPRRIYLAAQCCEHLNRALVIDSEALEFNHIWDRPVNVVPQPKAGGSFATATYKSLKNPVVLEQIQADAGIDIGGTLIGMHLKQVAVPVRLSINKIGNAPIICARTRLKYIGGVRAGYMAE